MPITRFPDPLSTAEDGIVAIGGDFHPESPLLAYRQGIFPWPIEGYPFVWFCPKKRGVLYFDQIHISRSLSKSLKHTSFRLTRDMAFKNVIEACAMVHAIKGGTWITPEIMSAYTELFNSGYAHSVEAWKDDELVGGIYGVLVDGVFSAESMFFTESYASKICLLQMIEWLKSQGLKWMDIQMVTPHMKSMGGIELSREEFLNLLKKSQKDFKAYTET